MAAMQPRLRLVTNGIPGWRRFPPNLFAIPFGLAGLAEAWHAAEQTLHTPEEIPDALSLRFAPGFWAFTFSWAATATDALEWIELRKPPGATAYAVAVLTVITVFIGYIAARTVILIARGQFLPAQRPAAPRDAQPHGSVPAGSA